MKKKTSKKKAKKKTEGIVDKKILENKQLLVILILMVVVFISIFGTYLLVKSMNQFKYHEFEFSRVKEGDLIFYVTRVFARDSNGNILDNEVYFRNDPRKLESMPIEGNLNIQIRGVTYISMDPNTWDCEQKAIAYPFAGLALKKALGVEDLKYASNNLDFARENTLDFATCEGRPQNTVIIIKKSEETIVRRTGGNCYEVEFKDCDEMLGVVERFIVGVMVDSSKNPA